MNTEIVAVSSEPVDEASKLKTEMGLSFPVLSDTTHSVIDGYGVFHENEAKGRPIARPATFVIDPEGTIRYRYVGNDPRDRPSIEELLEALSR